MNMGITTTVPTSDEIYAAGYALPLYGLETFTLRHKLQERTVTHTVVVVETYKGVPVVKWEPQC